MVLVGGQAGEKARDSRGLWGVQETNIAGGIVERGVGLH